MCVYAEPEGLQASVLNLPRRCPAAERRGGAEGFQAYVLNQPLCPAAERELLPILAIWNEGRFQRGFRHLLLLHRL